jgi:hypothetical protein
MQNPLIRECLRGLFCLRPQILSLTPVFQQLSLGKSSSPLYPLIQRRTRSSRRVKILDLEEVFWQLLRLWGMLIMQGHDQYRTAIGLLNMGMYLFQKFGFWNAGGCMPDWRQLNSLVKYREHNAKGLEARCRYVIYQEHINSWHTTLPRPGRYTELN